MVPTHRSNVGILASFSIFCSYFQAAVSLSYLYRNSHLVPLLAGVLVCWHAAPLQDTNTHRRQTMNRKHKAVGMMSDNV